MNPEDILYFMTLFYLSGVAVIIAAIAFMSIMDKRKYLKLWLLYWILLFFGYLLSTIGLANNLDGLLLIYYPIFTLASLVFLQATLEMTYREIKPWHKHLGALTIIIIFISYLLSFTDQTYIFISFILSSIIFVYGTLLILNTKGLIYKISGTFAFIVALFYILYPFVFEAEWYTPAGYVIAGFSGLIFGLSIIAVFFIELIDEHDKLTKQLYYKSFHDHLTKIYNRAYLDEQLTMHKNTHPISMIVIDLNNLKEINDSFGHRLGDEMIIKTARIIEQAAPVESVITRYGGDEFVVLLPHMKQSNARQIAHTIDKMTTNVQFKDKALKLAIGVASSINKEEPLSSVFDRAEKAMYYSKKANV